MRNHGRKIIFGTFTLAISKIKPGGVNNTLYRFDYDNKDKIYTTRHSRRHARIIRRYKGSMITRVMSKEL